MAIQGADVTGRLAVGMPSWGEELVWVSGKMGGKWGEEWGGQTSLEPRPKPFSTAPRMRRGKGDSGPDAGPMMEARGSWVLGGIFAAYGAARGLASG